MMQALQIPRQDETLIRLPRGGLLATVEEWSNELMVKSERIRVDKLIFSLLAILDSEELKNYLVHSGQKEFSLLDVFGPLIKEASDDKELYEVFDLFMDRFKQADAEIMLKFFSLFSNKINLASLNEVGLNKLLSDILIEVKQLGDSQYYDELLITLLENVDVSNKSEYFQQEVFSTLMKSTALQTEDHIMKRMFRTLTKHLTPAVRKELLAPYLSLHTVSSPLLPKNCLLYQEGADGRRIVALEIEKQMFNVQFGSNLFEKVGYPKLIFVFSVNPNGAIRLKVLAVKDTIISKDSKVYYYPYSNVQYHELSMEACWPELNRLANERDFYNNLISLSTLPYLFLNSPSNNDLYKYTNLRERLMNFEGQSFDDSILEDTGLTISNYMKT